MAFSYNPDPNADDEPFTPETLEAYAKLTEDLRGHCLFSIDVAAANSEAEQQFLMALSHLELAQRHFKLAALKQSLQQSLAELL